MAGYQMGTFYRPSPLTLDTHAHKYFEEDDTSILDENILDGSALDSGLEMSPSLDSSRRDSYALSAIFSPKTEDWHHVDMQSNPSNNPFGDRNHNPFMNASQAGSFAAQPRGWSLGHGSGSCTPMQQLDGLPRDFEGEIAVGYGASHGPAHVQTPFSNSGQHVAIFSPSNTSVGSMPTSPHKDFLLSDSLEYRGMPKRMRPSSPGLRSHSPLLRRDGIRKKNARFDIPVERTLVNIDQLIHQSKDEQEIKELKQQKRLLRNRQAALDSRQRKKQHTERLEDEKKHFTAMLNDLEEELAEAKLAMDDWTHKEQQYQQYIENLRMEKEEMMRAHTIETGDLRKKVSVLTEHVQKMESTAMASVSASNNFGTDYSDIDSLAMDGAWDNISFLNDFSNEHDVKPDISTLQGKKQESSLISEQDKPAAQGLLLMLLLFGAFVASKGTSPSMPRMSDDVRAASATLLEDIFNDAGVSQSAAHTVSSFVEASAPLPSGHAWSSASSKLGAADLSFGSSSLGSYADSLAHPSQEQEHEQLFSLSATQYNGLSSPDLHRRASTPTPNPSSSQGRRNLAESLAAMRSNSKHSAAEVYTRSLLWDQVPRDVVRNFAKMVSDCNSRSDHNPIGGNIG